MELILLEKVLNLGDLGDKVKVNFILFHGLTVEFALSLVAISLGAILFLSRHRVRAWQDRVLPGLSFNPEDSPEEQLRKLAVDRFGVEARNLRVGVDLADLGVDDVVERGDQLAPATEVLDQAPTARCSTSDAPSAASTGPSGGR